MKIIAVVVTFNRLELLKKVIGALKIQSRPLDKILIVNNGSTDGTTEWLQLQDDLTFLHQENLGGAGGFARGIQEAYDDGADWIWTMDDDVMPHIDCLETLLTLTSFSECLQPMRLQPDGKEFPWEHYYDAKNHRVITSKQNISFKDGKKFCFVNTVCFEGMLIFRSVVEKAGFPDSRFFISYDDSVYGLQVNRYTNILYSSEAKMQRLKEHNPRLSYMYLYFTLRNFHLVKEHVKAVGLGKISFVGHLNYLKLFLKIMGYGVLKLNFKYLWIGCKGVIDSQLTKTGKTF